MLLNSIITSPCATGWKAPNEGPKSAPRPKNPGFLTNSPIPTTNIDNFEVSGLRSAVTLFLPSLLNQPPPPIGRSFSPSNTCWWWCLCDTGAPAPCFRAGLR